MTGKYYVVVPFSDLRSLNFVKSKFRSVAEFSPNFSLFNKFHLINSLIILTIK